MEAEAADGPNISFRLKAEARARAINKDCTMDTVTDPFILTDWTTIPEVEYPGESGTAFWRTLQVGNTRIRMVRYSAGYLADHWCDRGHIVLVLSGELTTELNDGSLHRLLPGMSYTVATGRAPHRSRTVDGAVLFIVD